MSMSECRSCRAAVLWVRFRATGSRAPVDAAPSPEGNLRVYGDGTADVVPKGELAAARAAGEVLYLSHFVTCPFAARHRGKAKEGETC